MKMLDYYISTLTWHKDKGYPLILAIKEIEKAQFIIKCSKNANVGYWEANELPRVYFTK